MRGGREEASTSQTRKSRLKFQWPVHFSPNTTSSPPLLSRLSPNLIGLSVAAAVFSIVVQHRSRWWQAVNVLFDSCSRCLCVRLWSGLPGSGTSGGKHYSPTAGRPSKHPQRCPSHEERRNTGNQKEKQRYRKAIVSKHGILGIGHWAWWEGGLRDLIKCIWDSQNIPIWPLVYGLNRKLANWGWVLHNPWL